jgi:hypothetical protein
MALSKTNNSAELNPHDGSIERIVNGNLGIGYESKQTSPLRQPKQPYLQPNTTHYLQSPDKNYYKISEDKLR